ncbi:hypothetical protein Dimus_004096 [Dionaea muscipula]
MYASCGSVNDANRLFDGGNSDGGDSVYPWNALLRGSVVSGWRRYGDVLLAYSRMRELGVELNEYSFSCLIKSFAGAMEFRRDLKAHGLLIRNGWIGSSVLRTCLIDIYSKCRKIKLACQVDESTRGGAELGFGSDILPVIGELGALQLGKEVHAYAVKTKSYAQHLFV